jgi:hypothetical protein
VYRLCYRSSTLRRFATFAFFALPLSVRIRPRSGFFLQHLRQKYGNNNQRALAKSQKVKYNNRERSNKVNLVGE